MRTLATSCSSARVLETLGPSAAGPPRELFSPPSDLRERSLPASEYSTFIRGLADWPMDTPSARSGAMSAAPLELAWWGVRWGGKG